METYSGPEGGQLVVATDWLDQICSTPGCYVIIRQRAGRQSPLAPVCKYCVVEELPHPSYAKRKHMMAEEEAKFFKKFGKRIKAM